MSSINQINSIQVNKDGSNWAGGFNSQQAGNYSYGLFNPFRGGIAAASASALQKGGRKGRGRKGKPTAAISRKKIKNIVHLYRMPRGKKVRTMRKKKLLSLYRRRTRGTKKGFKGGSSTYHQFGSQIPNTGSYSVGATHLNPLNSALANPPPFQKLSNCTNCIDNFNMNTKSGFQFW